MPWLLTASERSGLAHNVAAWKVDRRVQVGDLFSMDEPKEYLVSHWLTSMCHEVALSGKTRSARSHGRTHSAKFPHSPVNRVENFFFCEL